MDHQPATPYEDFDLEISGPANGRYLVTVASPGGETSAPVSVELPFDQPALRQLESDLKITILRSATTTRRAESREDRAVRDFGQQLFQAVFVGEVAECFRGSKHLSAGRGNNLRIRLTLAPEVATLPWELLYDPFQKRYLALDDETTLVRYVKQPTPRQPLTVELPLRILAMSPSPISDELPALNVEREKHRMHEALADLIDDGRVELHWQGETFNDLDRETRHQLRNPWHVFHFVGHGAFNESGDEGQLYFTGRFGEPDPMPASALAQALGGSNPVRLVVLNACEGGVESSKDAFSGIATAVARQGVPAVIAMRTEISDAAAIEFSRSFYTSVAAGNPIEAAMTSARRSITITAPRSIEWSTPMLYIRTADDGVLFEINRGEAQDGLHGRGRRGPAPAQHVSVRASSPIQKDGIYVSFRRGDHSSVEPIIAALREEFKGRVVADVAFVASNDDWRGAIERAIDSCGAVVCLIGEAWVKAVPRLMNPYDTVRCEIEFALTRDIPVIPVLLNQEGMPENLPPPIASLGQRLAFFAAAPPRPGDMHALINGLRFAVEGTS